MQPGQGIPGQGNAQWQQSSNILSQQMSSGMVSGMDMAGQIPGGLGGDDLGLSSAPLSYNQKTSERMRLDEGMLLCNLL